MNWKKYDLISIILVVVSISVLALGALIFGSFGNELGDDLRESAYETIGENTNTQVATDFIANDTKTFSDNFFFWFLIASFIGILITGLFLEFEPVTMIIIFVIGSIAIAFAYLGSNLYTGFQEEIIGSEEMVKTNVIMNPTYFPIFVFIMLIILVVVMYNRKRGIEA